MVETAADCVRHESLALHQIEHALLDREHALQRDDPLRGRRLVRDRHEQIARLAKAAEGPHDTRYQCDVVRVERRLG
jgi:hypothetical protein